MGHFEYSNLNNSRFSGFAASPWASSSCFQCPTSGLADQDALELADWGTLDSRDSCLRRDAWSNGEQASASALRLRWLCAWHGEETGHRGTRPEEGRGRTVVLIPVAVIVGVDALVEVEPCPLRQRRRRVLRRTKALSTSVLGRPGGRLVRTRQAREASICFGRLPG